MVRSKLWLVAATMVAVSVPAVAGAQCVIFQKPEDLFARADVVFLRVRSSSSRLSPSSMKRSWRRCANGSLNLDV
jgi:hypothetical protein